MFIEDAIQFAYRQCGATTADLSVDLLRSDVLPQVIRAFSERAPRRRALTMTVVAGQTYYALPDPLLMDLEIAQHPDDAGISDLGDDDDDLCDVQVTYTGAEETLWTYSTPQLVHVAKDIYLPGALWTVTLVGDRVAFEPTPETGGLVHLIGRMGWAFTEEVTITAAAAQVVFPLAAGHRIAWGVQVTLDGSPLEQDFVTVASGNPASVTLSFAPGDGVEVGITYSVAASFEAVPLGLRTGFTYLLTALLAEALGQKRARYPEVNIGSGKMKIGSKDLLASAKIWMSRAEAELEGVDADAYLAQGSP